MSRLIWVTDLHLNCAEEVAQAALVESIRQQRPDHLLIGGDIAEAPTFADALVWLAEEVACPLWFVLGNHDYYRGSIAGVRQVARELITARTDIGWLPACDIVPLSSDTALIGHGGWGDARAGDWENTSVMLNDYFLIEELQSAHSLSKHQMPFVPDRQSILNESLRQRLHALGDEAAAHLRVMACKALQTFRRVFVLMHVPPFVEACWYQGRAGDANWSPHFVCAAAGETLREVMTDHPDQSMVVLCGHTHNGGVAQILPNLRVITGEAQYGQPVVQQTFDLDEMSGNNVLLT